MRLSCLYSCRCCTLFNLSLSLSLSLYGTILIHTIFDRHRYSHELATKSFLIFRLLKGGELVTGAISFFTCLASFVWIVKTASWSNFTVLRSAPVFVLSCFLLWPLNMKEKTAKLKNDQDDEDTMATWYRGVETKRMSRGIGVIMAPCVELILLKRANNGLYGLYDLFALFTFGFSMVSLNFFSGMAVKVAAKTKSVDTSSRDREKAMRCAFSLACGFVAIFIRVVVLVWWYPIEGISMPVSYVLISPPQFFFLFFRVHSFDSHITLKKTLSTSQQIR